MATDEKNVFGLREYSRKDLFQDTTDEIREADRFYIMHEADKVIALLKDKANYNEYAYKLKSEELADTCRFYEDEIRHNKYKRCLDNAWGCQQRMELFHELALEEARTIALPNEKALKEYRTKRERAAKWRKRWLKIAEQFKGVK